MKELSTEKIMTLQQLKTIEEDIHNEASKRIEKIRKDYGLQNNPYEIGDIIEDHYHRIMIESFKIATCAKPEGVYKGVQLTKKNTPNKNQLENIMYQSNVERLIKESK